MDDLRSINSDGTAQAGRIPASVGRDLGLDVAKGIAIACVVIGHVIRGFQSAGLLEYNLFLQVLDNFMYGFHVQLFFMISIYIAYPKANSFLFQINRNSFLYYAYILWSLLSWVFGYAAGSAVNHRPELSQLYAIPYVPYAHFWFLLVLIITFIIAGVLRRTWLLIAGMIICVILVAANILGWCQLNYFLLFGLAGGA